MSTFNDGFQNKSLAANLRKASMNPTELKKSKFDKLEPIEQ
jgi:hypothetical protein